MVANVNICAKLVVMPPRGPLNLNGYNSEVITQGKVRNPIIDEPTWPPIHASAITDGAFNLNAKKIGSVTWMEFDRCQDESMDDKIKPAT